MVVEGIVEKLLGQRQRVMNSEEENGNMLNVSNTVLARTGLVDPSCHRLPLLFQSSTDHPTFSSITVLIEQCSNLKFHITVICSLRHPLSFFSGCAQQGMSFPLASTKLELHWWEWKECKNYPGGMKADAKFENCCSRQKLSLT